MFTIRQAESIIGDYCALLENKPRNKAKYILIDRDGAWATGINCMEECEHYGDRSYCGPKPYKVVPITKELLSALKLCFPKLDDYDCDEFDKRQKEVKKFVEGWIKKK